MHEDEQHTAEARADERKAETKKGRRRQTEASAPVRQPGLSTRQSVFTELAPSSLSFSASAPNVLPDSTSSSTSTMSRPLTSNFILTLKITSLAVRDAP